MEVGDFIELVVSCAPIRTQPSDISEMCTEALAGEVAVVQEIGTKDWIRIQLVGDDYEGWTDRKQWFFFHAGAAKHIGAKYFRVQSPVSPWLRPDGAVLQLPAGSIVSLGDDHSTWSLAGNDLSPLFPLDDVFQAHQSPLDAAQAFIGSPYRWGGRSVWGMDCSGLIQLAYVLCGKKLPRDASQQALKGGLIHWVNRSPGDLVFFKNVSGSITHVGILKTLDTIIHAAGEVRLDAMKEDGIWRDQTKTHSISCIRRID